MTHYPVKAIAQLTRVDTSLLVFASVFIPLLLQTNDLTFAATQALPLFTSAACTFVLNDVADFDKDKINHPERPIASLKINQAFAIAIYFFLLLLSLVFVKLFIDREHVFVYTSFIVVITNYDHIVSYFPRLKNAYVAAATVFPILILWSVSQEEKPYEIVSLILIFYVFARELLMDDLDRAGDRGTLAQMVSRKAAFQIASTMQLASIAGFAFCISQTFHIGLYVISLLITGLSLWLWGASKERLSLLIMKLNIFAGVAYLV